MMKRTNKIARIIFLLGVICLVLLLSLFKYKADHPNTNEKNDYIDEKIENNVIESDRNEETEEAKGAELPELEADVKSDEDTAANDSENDHPATSGDAEHDSEQQSDPEDDQKDIYIDEDGDIELPEVP